MTEKRRCNVCEEVVDGPFCQDGACKSCHKSVSWEDCTDGTYNAQHLLANGYSHEEVLRRYPEARV